MIYVNTVCVHFSKTDYYDYFCQLLVGDNPSLLHFQCHQRESLQRFNFREVRFMFPFYEPLV